MKRILTILLVAIFISTIPLSAEYYIKQKTHTDEFEIMGQKTPAKDEITHLWFGDKKMAMLGDQNSSIIDLNSNVLYMINHADKSYVEMTLPLDISKYFPPMLQQMMGNVTVTVTPTGEKQKINEWTCEGYDVTMNVMMMNMKMKWWSSTEVPFDWKTYTDTMYSTMTQATMRLSEDAMKEFQKIQGWTIKQDISMSMMGTDMKTTTEVMEISEKSAPEGTFVVPEGYTKKDKFTMQDLQR